LPVWANQFIQTSTFCLVILFTIPEGTPAIEIRLREAVAFIQTAICARRFAGWSADTFA